MELQGRFEQLQRQGVGLAAISYDPVPVLADFSTRRAVTFPLLSDPGSVTIKQYGIFNTTIPETNAQAYGIPFPGTFLVNAHGVVMSRFFEPAYQERNTIGSIWARLGQRVDVAGTRVSSPQLEVTTYATDSTVAPGTHFALVLDMRPARGIHLYAPGVSGYQAVALTIQSQRWIEAKAPQYPASSDYYFKPLNEHVPVFQQPFRIVQDIAVVVSPEAQAALKDIASLSIRGTLSYQACNDTLCSTPQTVPLTWTVRVRQLDRERARR